MTYEQALALYSEHVEQIGAMFDQPCEVDSEETAEGWILGNGSGKLATIVNGEVLTD